MLLGGATLSVPRFCPVSYKLFLRARASKATPIHCVVSLACCFLMQPSGRIWPAGWLTCCSLIQESGRIWPAGRLTSVQVALQVSQVQAFRAVSVSCAQFTGSQSRFTVLKFSCYPSDRLPQSSIRGHARLVDPLLYYPSEVLQLRFVYIYMKECLQLAVTVFIEGPLQRIYALTSRRKSKWSPVFNPRILRYRMQYAK